MAVIGTTADSLMNTILAYHILSNVNPKARSEGCSHSIYMIRKLPTIRYNTDKQYLATIKFNAE